MTDAKRLAQQLCSFSIAFRDRSLNMARLSGPEGLEIRTTFYKDSEDGKSFFQSVINNEWRFIQESPSLTAPIDLRLTSVTCSMANQLSPGPSR